MIEFRFGLCSYASSAEYLKRFMALPLPRGGWAAAPSRAGQKEAGPVGPAKSAGNKAVYARGASILNMARAVCFSRNLAPAILLGTIA